MTRRRKLDLLALAVLGLAGCATTAQPLASSAGASEPVAVGDPDAPPALSALPELAEGASGATARTHQGMLVAREAFDAAMPDPPADRSYWSLQQWVDTALVSWLEHRRAQTEAVRDRFMQAGELSAGERAVSLAVLGLLHEDTAVSLTRIPAPRELDNEPEIAAMYADVVSVQGDAFLASALLAFRDCASEAYQAEDDMRGYAAFCRARFERIRGQLRAARQRRAMAAQ